MQAPRPASPGRRSETFHNGPANEASCGAADQAINQSIRIVIHFGSAFLKTIIGLCFYAAEPRNCVRIGLKVTRAGVNNFD